MLAPELCADPMKTTTFLDRVLVIAMILAPILLLASTLVSLPDDDFAESVPQGVLVMFAMGLFFLAFVAVTRLLGQRLPRLSALLLLTGALGAQAGTAFGVVVIARAKGLELQAGSLEAAFNAPGILFPMTWLALGACVLYAKVAPAWTGIALALAGVAFPVSRIGTVGEIAVVADVLFVVALSGFAMVVLRGHVASPATQPSLA